MTVTRRRALVLSAGAAAGLLLPGEAVAKPPPGKGKPPRVRTVTTSDGLLGVDVRTINVTVGPPGGGGTLLGWEVTAANVGLAALGINGNTLPDYYALGGAYTVASGTTISGYKIIGGLDLKAGNITVERCYFRPTDATAGGGWPITYTYDPSTGGDPAPGEVTIRDCEIDGSDMSASHAGLADTTGHIGVANLYRNVIHHLGGGIGTLHCGSTFSCVVENNYVYDMVSVGDPATTGNHCDSWTVRDFSDAPGRTLMVRNNRFDCTTANATGSCFIQGNAGPIANVTIQGNYLEGDGWNLGLEPNNYGYSNIDIINNRFRSTGTGRAYYSGGTGYDAWSENYDYHATNPDHKGAVVNEP